MANWQRSGPGESRRCARSSESLTIFLREVDLGGSQLLYLRGSHSDKETRDRLSKDPCGVNELYSSWADSKDLFDALSQASDEGLGEQEGTYLKSRYSASEFGFSEQVREQRRKARNQYPKLAALFRQNITDAASDSTMSLECNRPRRRWIPSGNVGPRQGDLVHESFQ